VPRVPLVPKRTFYHSGPPIHPVPNPTAPPQPPPPTPRTVNWAESAPAVSNATAPPPPSTPTPRTVNRSESAPAKLQPTAAGPTLPTMPEPVPEPLIQRAVFQQPMRDEKKPAEDLQEYQIQLEPPGIERWSQLDSEASLQERMRQEARERRAKLERIYFPDEPILSKEPYAGRQFPPALVLAEPSYVCHERLLFQDLNSERYGWDLGFIQPFVSTGKFFFDAAIWPYNLVKEPCRHYECSAGYCLPGDPVPYLLYPPEFSVTGWIAEAGVVIAGFAIFP